MQVPVGDKTPLAATPRKALLGFFLAGLLMSFLGAILPAWGYHLKSDFSAVGLYFLSMALGILASVTPARRLIPSKGIAFVMVLGSALACASFLYLAWASPSVLPWWRLGGVLSLGLSIGLLTSALFYAVSPLYRLDPAATVNLAGVLFVLGCLTMALLVAGAFYVYTVPSFLFLLAFVPGFLAGILARSHLPPDPIRDKVPWRQVWLDFRSPSAILFSLILFFQFGNEWSIAGWLNIFLIQRLGVSPASSLLLLALYWLALLVGRIVAQFLLPRFRHGMLLMGSVVAGLFGCLILMFTNNVFGAASGILFVGGGFAMVYPLVVEKIGRRFPYFHPGLFNGIFSFAMIGGLLAPWTLGYLADIWGISAVMVVPMLGTCMVFVLLVLIWLEAKLTGMESR